MRRERDDAVSNGMSPVNGGGCRAQAVVGLVVQRKRKRPRSEDLGSSPAPAANWPGNPSVVPFPDMRNTTFESQSNQVWFPNASVILRACGKTRQIMTLSYLFHKAKLFSLKDYPLL